MSGLTERRSFLVGLAGLSVLPGQSIARETTEPDTAILAAIQAYERAVVDEEHADAEAEAAQERYIALGGLPDFAEAFYEREGDHNFGIHHSELIRDPDGYVVRRYPSAFHLHHLRTHPRTRSAVKYWKPIPHSLRDDYVEPRRIRDGVEEYGIHGQVPWPEAQARADEILAAHDARQAELHRRREVSGLAAACESADAALDARTDAARAIATTTTATMAGLLTKARFLATRWFDGPDDLASEVEHLTSDVDALSLSIVRDLLGLAEASGSANWQSLRPPVAA